MGLGGIASSLPACSRIGSQEDNNHCSLNIYVVTYSLSSMACSCCMVPRHHHRGTLSFDGLGVTDEAFCSFQIRFCHITLEVPCRCINLLLDSLAEKKLLVSDSRPDNAEDQLLQVSSSHRRNTLVLALGNRLDSIQPPWPFHLDNIPEWAALVYHLNYIPKSFLFVHQYKTLEFALGIRRAITPKFVLANHLDRTPG